MLEAGTIVHGIPIDCTDKGTDWVMFWVRAYKWRFMQGGGGWEFEPIWPSGKALGW